VTTIDPEIIDAFWELWYRHEDTYGHTPDLDPTLKRCTRCQEAADAGTLVEIPNDPWLPSAKETHQ
jgi:hypothetical protein